jgi:hypothetical protein
LRTRPARSSETAIAGAARVTGTARLAIASAKDTVVDVVADGIGSVADLIGTARLTEIAAGNARIGRRLNAACSGRAGRTATSRRAAGARCRSTGAGRSPAGAWRRSTSAWRRTAGARRRSTRSGGGAAGA